jgi:two-component system, NarL family, nitrate/nitrite response regulator NarL
MAVSALRVVLVDDHEFVRSAIRHAISAPDIEVVGEAGSAEEAVEVATREHPDVVLLDIDLPGVSGVRILRELTPRLPDTHFVMLTVSENPRDMVDAIRSGADGYLTKSLSPAALQRSVRGIRHGDLPMPRRLAARLVRELARPSPGNADRSLPSTLTSREVEILRLLARGLTDREIADALTISARTVETHVGNILRKLGVHRRAEAARQYREDA